MGNVIAFARCEVEVDANGLPTSELVDAAFAKVDVFAVELDEQLQREGVKYRRVKVRPVPSAELLAAMKRPNAFRLEVEYEPVEAGKESR